MYDNINRIKKLNLITNTLHKSRTNTLKNKLHNLKYNFQIYSPTDDEYLKHANKMIKVATKISRKSNDIKHYHLGKIKTLNKKLETATNPIHRKIILNRLYHHEYEANKAHQEYKNYKNLVNNIYKNVIHKTTSEPYL